MPIRNWNLTMQHLHIKFGDKIKPSATPFRVLARCFQTLSTNPKRSDMTQFALRSQSFGETVFYCLRYQRERVKIYKTDFSTTTHHHDILTLGLLYETILTT